MSWLTTNSQGELKVIDTGADQIALNDLTDATITSPVDGQTVTYNSGTGMWVNKVPPQVLIHTTGDFITTVRVPTKVPFAAAQTDTDSMWDSGNQRIKFPTAGTYIVGFHIQSAEPVVNIDIGGDLVTNAGVLLQDYRDQGGGAGAWTDKFIGGTTVFTFAQNDFMECQVYWDLGGAGTHAWRGGSAGGAGNKQCQMWANRIG